MHPNQDNIVSFHPDRSLDNLPPQNIEAEVAILGGIMLDPEAITRVSDRLVVEAFYISAHSYIYQAATTLHALFQPTDLLTVTAWLADHNLLNRIGGRNKLATLVDRTVSAVNIDALADLVMEKYRRRQLIKVGNEIVHLGYETERVFIIAYADGLFYRQQPTPWTIGVKLRQKPKCQATWRCCVGVADEQLSQDP